jgi:hypothetical protein
MRRWRSPLKRAHVLESLPFNARQIRQFIDNWYLASETVSSGYKQDDGVRQRAAKGTRELLKALNEKPSLNDLTVNPLLLTMVAMVHRYHGALPGSRIELYAEICQVLLGRWRQNKGVKDKLSVEQKLVVLRPLAAHLMANQTREITTNSAKEIIAGPLERVGLNRDEAEKFLSDTQSSSGLLLEREAGRWSFAHLTFQEFLTAAHWLEQKETTYDWVAMVNDSWWHETLRLYAAQGDATSLAQACLGANTITALMLAVDCLEEGREIAPDVRYALEACVIAGLDSDNIALRRLAAEVKLSRRLASLKRVDDHRAIDLDLLSCAEYQLFLDEMRTQEKHYQPDHWPNHYFVKGQADMPVAGMRAEDAKAFCEWLTRRQGGEGIYRLPKLDEAADAGLPKGKIACWYEEETGFSLVGMLQTDKKDIQQQVESLCRPVLSIWQPHSIITMMSDNDNLTKSLGFVRFGILAFNLHLLLAICRLIARITYSVISHIPARDLDLAFAFDLDRTCDLARDLACDRDLALALALNLNRDLDRDLDRARALTQAFSLVFTINYVYMNDLSYIWKRSLDDNLQRLLLVELSELDTKSEKKTMYISRSLQALQENPEMLSPHVQAALPDIIAFTSANSPPGSRHAYRRLIARMLEIALTSDQSPAYQIKPRWWRRLGQRQANDADQKRARELAAQLYSWLQVVIAREEGKLPAWEGIRIVRELPKE